MPSDTQQLILQMKADLDQYNRDILKAQKSTEKFQKETADGLTTIEKNTKKAGDSMFRFSNVAKGVFAALSVGVLTNFADEIQLADNQLRNVTTSVEQFNLVQMELNRIAIETRQNVNDLTAVYARFTRAGQEAGFAQQEILDLTEALTKAFKIEGNSTAEVNSTLLQLTQSFRSGRIQGEEFRAVSESSTLVLQALAKQLGVTTGELKKLAADGLVTPEALVKGLKELAPEIDKQFATLEPTFADLGAKLGTVFASAYRDSVIDQTVGNFKMLVDKGLTEVDRLLNGENKTQEELRQQIIDTQAEIQRLTELQKKNGLDYGMSIRRNIADLEEYKQRLKEVQEAEGNQLTAPLEVEVTKGIEDPQIERNNMFLERMNEFHQIKTETLEEQFLLEAAIQKAALDAQLINDEQFYAAQAELAKKFAKEKEKEVKNEKALDLERISSQRKFIAAASVLANAFFEDNKAINAGLIVADTAAAITHSLKINPYDYANVAIIAATGVAQLANVLSASKGGGGSVDTGNSGGSTQPPQDFQPDTSAQDVNISEVGDTITTSQQEIVFASDGGSPAEQFLAESLNDARRRGSIDVRG